MLKIGFPRRFINKAYIELQISLPNRIRYVPNVNKRSDPNYSCRTLVKNSILNKKIINRQHLIEPNYTQLKLCSGTSNAQAAAIESQSYFRTIESDPRNHDERHLGRIYTMPGKRLMFPSLWIRNDFSQPLMLFRVFTYSWRCETTGCYDGEVAQRSYSQKVVGVATTFWRALISYTSTSTGSHKLSEPNQGKGDYL